MLKKIRLFVIAMIVSIACVEAYADIKSHTQMVGVTKMGNSAPNIKLAVNDVMQLQNVNIKKVSIKAMDANQSASQLSEIPAQAWSILAALFYFVMRSSRRVVS